MPNGYNKDNSDNKNDQLDGTIVIQTDEGAQNGQDKCPKCGSTDISLNINTGKLRCNFCRCEFDPEKLDSMEQDLSKLKGQVMGSGATDIALDANDIVTFKCSSCGAEVVVDTSSAPQARCHWCRNTLSVNEQIPNGTIPDVVLPFGITKDVAKAQIEKFVGKRKFFAHPKFRQEFKSENIMGVYLPYMVVDANSHVKLAGNGEILTGVYSHNNSNDATTYYDADLYYVEREFDLVIQGLTIESSADKLNNSSASATNNVINAIMPFDIENCIKFNANYLKGYTSEKRDTNIDQLRPLVDKESKDIARFAVNDTLEKYDRGVAWSEEELNVKGQQWQAAYLPVWLYSYLQVNGKKKVLHYVAVNARTKETMGSVPIHMPKLVGMSILVEFLGILAMAFIDFDYNWLFLFVGFVYFFIMFSRYRNSAARHKYETETKTNVTNLRKVDTFIKSESELTNSRIYGANNNTISAEKLETQIINSLVDQNPVASIIRDITKKK